MGLYYFPLPNFQTKYHILKTKIKICIIYQRIGYIIIIYSLLKFSFGSLSCFGWSQAPLCSFNLQIVLLFIIHRLTFTTRKCQQRSSSVIHFQMTPLKPFEVTLHRYLVEDREKLCSVSKRTFFFSIYFFPLCPIVFSLTLMDKKCVSHSLSLSSHHLSLLIKLLFLSRVVCFHQSMLN